MTGAQIHKILERPAEEIPTGLLSLIPDSARCLLRLADILVYAVVNEADHVIY